MPPTDGSHYRKQRSSENGTERWISGFSGREMRLSHVTRELRPGLEVDLPQCYRKPAMGATAWRGKHLKGSPVKRDPLGHHARHRTAIHTDPRCTEMDLRN